MSADDVRLYNLKDVIRVRCRGMCEHCGLRRGVDLHHRHYSTVGCETTEDVMLVCRSCHRFIHGGVRQVSVAEGSLAYLGDNGFGIMSAKHWLAYLKRVEQ